MTFFLWNGQISHEPDYCTISRLSTSLPILHYLQNMLSDNVAVGPPCQSRSRPLPLLPLLFSFTSSRSSAKAPPIPFTASQQTIHKARLSVLTYRLRHLRRPIRLVQDNPPLRHIQLHWPRQLRVSFRSCILHLEDDEALPRFWRSTQVIEVLQSATHAARVGFWAVHLVGLGLWVVEVGRKLFGAVAVVEGGEAAAPVGDGLGSGDLGYKSALAKDGT